MRWAIIDDGVNIDTPAIVRNIEIDGCGIMKDRTVSAAVNHATVCFRIIQKYADDLHDVVSIKILDDTTHRANIKALITALHWCIENEVRLIHMSIGTTEGADCELMRDMIHRLTEQGIVVVAANSNKGIQTYPAFDSRVIGVENDPTLIDMQYAYTPNSLNGIQFRASACHELDGLQYGKTACFNSFAAPLVTARILSMISQVGELSFEKAMKWLIKNANSTNENTVLTDLSEQDRCVVVVISCSNRIDEQNLLTGLKESFLSDGYICKILPLNNVCSLSLTQYLKWSKQFFSCDVLLIALDEDQINEVGSLIDLLIRDYETKDTFINEYEVLQFTKYSEDVKQIEKLYGEVLSKLSEEDITDVLPKTPAIICKGENA